MPIDALLKERILRRNVYKDIPTPRLRYILENIEYCVRDKYDEATVSTTNLQIEHVMPQRWAENWPLPNGTIATHEDSFEALIDGKPMDDTTSSLVDSRARLVNTFGNLTLITGTLNASYGKAGWKVKKEKLGRSLLALNRMVAGIENWGEDEIESRGTKIAGVVSSFWTCPKTL